MVVLLCDIGQLASTSLSVKSNHKNTHPVGLGEHRSRKCVQNHVGKSGDSRDAGPLHSKVSLPSVVG